MTARLSDTQTTHDLDGHEWVLAPLGEGRYEAYPALAPVADAYAATEGVGSLVGDATTLRAVIANLSVA